MSDATATRVQHPSIVVNGSPVAAAVLDALVDLSVENTVGLPAEAQITLRDPEFALVSAGPFAVGSSVAIKVPNDRGALTSIFDGVVYSMAVEQLGTTHELVIGALDKTLSLVQGTKVRSFVRQTTGEIVQTIARQLGLRAQVAPTPQRYEYLLQTGTDRAFLDQLALMEGMEWYLDAAVLHFKERAVTQGLSLTLGEDLLSFDARFAHRGGATQVEVRGWDRRTQQSLSSKVAVDAQRLGKTTGATFASRNHNDAARSGSKHVLLAAPHVVDTVSEGTKMAGALADRLAGEEIQVRGETVGNPSLKVGQAVSIAGVGPQLSGTYVVTSVEHVFGQDLALTTRFRAGGGDPGGLGELVGERPATSLLATLVIGKVTNNNDPENLGRVKVKFPTLSDNEESNWARVLTIASGSAHGVQVLPEVNDEVLVGFEHGDMRHPVVIGGLYSGKNKPPLTSTDAVKSGKVASWLLKSRSGNTLQFLDGASATEASVLMRHANTQNLFRVEDKRIELLGKAGTELSIKIGNASISITANGDIVLDGANITLKARQDIKLQAGIGLEAKGNTMAKLLAGSNGFEASPASAAVKGTPLVQIQGAMVKVG
jgi:uncharacterized protein involved in type VI secretion and phage assembly